LQTEAVTMEKIYYKVSLYHLIYQLFFYLRPLFMCNFRGPPNTLILHLKRFNFLSERKIESEIKYPLFGLDLSPYIFSDQSEHVNETTEEKSHTTSSHLYDLMGVICHRGYLNRGYMFYLIIVNYCF
jgi:ubiquitin C-terminal hydrolase